MNNNYSILLKIVDSLREDAPLSNKFYHCDPSNQPHLDQARTRSFIHLFLKAKFGIESFQEREKCITDGEFDGGLDAYFIDGNKKVLYLIQSKFRKDGKTFEDRHISFDELLKMDLKLIISGTKRDSNGHPFNSKIIELQKKIYNLGNIIKYEKKVIILANLPNVNDNKIRRLIDNFNFEVFNFKRTYSELVYPLCSGTLYKPEEILIKINLEHKKKFELDQIIRTKYGDYKVIITFVPTFEIGRIMNKYKNSILLYNPRNYLTLSKNGVNTKIKESIVKLTTNDFALLNNGITIIADDAETTPNVGKENEGQIIVTNPQIINGGQTAFTLSEIYKDYPDPENDYFSKKEVLVKIISVNKNEQLDVDFVKMISTATNQQTRIDESDQRSNDPIQKRIQSEIFEKYGYFYERKLGEFYDGLLNGYIEKKIIIDREEFMRAYLAFTGNPSDARRMGGNNLFKESFFNKTIRNISDLPEMFFAFILLKSLNTFRKSLSKQQRNKYGFTMKYGRLSVIAAIGNSYYNSNSITLDKDFILDYSFPIVSNFIKIWPKYEKHIIRLTKNSDYFSRSNKDFDNYYKGKTINDDIINYFKKPLDKCFKRKK